MKREERKGIPLTTFYTLYTPEEMLSVVCLSVNHCTVCAGGRERNDPQRRRSESKHLVVLV